MIGNQCQLYRHFSKDGELLYVGISRSALLRISGHKNAEWFPSGLFTVENFPSREDAETAERKAIKEEKPKYNRAHVNPSKTEKIKTATLKRAIPKRDKRFDIYLEGIDEDVKTPVPLRRRELYLAIFVLRHMTDKDFSKFPMQPWHGPPDRSRDLRRLRESLQHLDDQIHSAVFRPYGNSWGDYIHARIWNHIGRCTYHQPLLDPKHREAHMFMVPLLERLERFKTCRDWHELMRLNLGKRI